MEHEDRYLQICEDLKKIVEKTGEALEGNCMYKHLSFEQWDCLLNKRKNYQILAKNKKMICEIGFNAGHSLLSMILVNPYAKYTLFDLGNHAYSMPCFEYLKNKFPEVDMEILWGDSRNTLPLYHTEHPSRVFDLLHIDGGHKYEVYSADLTNSLKLTSVGSTIIFDDTDNKKISAFLDVEMVKHSLEEINNLMKTSGYEHRVFIRK